jgi:polysaccharide biosynthesis/export protein
MSALTTVFHHHGRKLQQSALLMFCALFFWGCASALPQAPTKADLKDFTYRVGPGDALQILVWRNPELSGTYSVRPDGKLTTPLVEDLPVTGKTPTEIARIIETQLAKFLQEPVVTVLVGGFVGQSEHQVKVVGQATKPQAIPYREKMTVLDVMIAVGGLTEFAAGNRATLVRLAPAASGKTESYRVRLHDLIKKGDVTANVDMMPGDVIIIPESWF